MNEERWHNFAKEKPSEDMEGRNFIVSNGHYEKIATWCGYWENEPFMGDHLCDEVVRWKFYFTPEEEKANDATHTELKPMKCDELKQVEYPIEWGLYYDKDEVDTAIAELKQKLKGVQANAYAESVDAGMENNILKRALWLTRALRARDIQRWWLQVTCSPRTEIACRKWNNVERKCRAKAEEYR